MDAVRPRAAFAMYTPMLAGRIFSAQAKERLRSMLDIDTEAVLFETESTEARALLAEVDVLVTGWGCPFIDQRVLELAPKLRLVAHSGGTVKNLAAPAAWARGITVTNSAAVNSIPVAEFTVAAIIMANKAALPAARLYRNRRGLIDREIEFERTGNYEATVGIIGASMIGRLTIERLSAFDLDVVVYDPYLSDEEAVTLGVRKVSLHELMEVSDVVSLHAPDLPSTRGMIDAECFALMKDGATFINTARGIIVDQDAMIAELASGRIEAVLDVAEPDVLPPDCPLYDMPNVLLTPHIAGAMGRELHRLGDNATEQVRQYLAGSTPRYTVTVEQLATMA